MKKTLISLALLAAFTASAQTTVDSSAGSASNAGAASQSGAAVNANNSGNVSATGNENASRSQSASQSGAISGSQSGALGNAVYIDQSGPSSQTVNQTVNGTSTSNNTSTVNGTSTENVKYSGTIENKSSGGTYDRADVNYHYSGSQTVKNVPGIAMSGPASGPCTGASGGIGLAGPGWGVGLNGSAVMDDCRMRENTRVLGMGMQSLDGGANPQEKGEATVMFMDAMRGLAAYNKTIIDKTMKESK
jgi:hypothetical protein